MRNICLLVWHLMSIEALCLTVRSLRQMCHTVPLDEVFGKQFWKTKLFTFLSLLILCPHHTWWQTPLIIHPIHQIGIIPMKYYFEIAQYLKNGFNVLSIDPSMDMTWQLYQWNQKPRNKLSVLLLLLWDCRQIFASPSKSLQACQNIRYRKHCMGWVVIVVVVCFKIWGKIEKLSDWNKNWCGSRFGPSNYDSGLW